MNCYSRHYNESTHQNKYKVQKNIFENIQVIQSQRPSFTSHFARNKAKNNIQN